MTSLPRFAGRVAWVTGAGHGIGASVAIRLASEGASVGLLARNQEGVDVVARRCQAYGARTIAVACDAADPGCLAAAHSRITEGLGVVSILVNNVAVALEATVDRWSEEHWATVIATNLMSYARCSALVIDGMRGRGGGTIINIGSIQGRRGFPGWGAYASAKGAIQALTRELSVELGPSGIRFNTVSPGSILTPMNARRFSQAPDPDAMRASFIAAIPLGRLGMPEEIAAAVAFLASDEASFITGADLVIDGGQIAKGS